MATAEVEKKTFVFDLNFDTEAIKTEHDNNINSDSTEISFLTLTEQIFNEDKHHDRRIDLDINKIRENVLITLIPTLFFYKEKNIVIEIVDGSEEKTATITQQDIPDFLEKYSAHTLDKLKAGGASQIEIDKQTKEMANFAAMYKNPFFNAMMTYMEILPVGLIVTLISSLILKRKTAKNLSA